MLSIDTDSKLVTLARRTAVPGSAGLLDLRRPLNTLKHTCSCLLSFSTWLKLRPQYLHATLEVFKQDSSFGGGIGSGIGRGLERLNTCSQTASWRSNREGVANLRPQHLHATRCEDRSGRTPPNVTAESITEGAIEERRERRPKLGLVLPSSSRDSVTLGSLAATIGEHGEPIGPGAARKDVVIEVSWSKEER